MSTQSFNFTWKLSAKQRELFESDARFRVGMMGRRFGKNEVSTAIEVDYATQPHKYTFGTDDPDGGLVWHIAPTYRQAYRHGYLKVMEKLPDALVDDDNTRGSEWSPSKVTLVTGFELEFLSYGNPKGLQGEGVDLIVGDEWAYSDPEIWDKDLRPMLLDTGGGAVLISKPLGENHFYDHYCMGAIPDQIHGDGQPRRDEWESFHATGYDSPFIPDSELDSIKETTPESVFRQEYLADPASGGTLLTLDMLSSEPVSVLDERDAGYWNWHVSVDLGVEMSAAKARENDTDYWALAIVAEHPRQPLAYLCEVRRRRGQAPSQAAQWINDVIEWVPTRRVKYEKVQAQAWFEQHLQDEGLTPVPHTPNAKKEDRIIGLSVPFSNEQVKLLDWSELPKEMDWSDFRTEWAGFPGGKVDQLDAVAQALDDVNFGTNVRGDGLDLYGRDR
ncbi:terminase large subunit [Haloferax tailed virus 1]|uniref:Terminase large subunit n=1 Tax=Haloferax tailed virus 1 TaxID=2507575 RepID=A0A410N6Z4_HFTV1|nr:terminase large subunit [Haloferax tailed virus 1]QAS68835.1 terminase large subunit [Haloferax tailed virus 1]